MFAPFLLHLHQVLNNMGYISNEGAKYLEKKNSMVGNQYAITRNAPRARISKNPY